MADVQVKKWAVGEMGRLLKEKLGLRKLVGIILCVNIALVLIPIIRSILVAFQPEGLGEMGAFNWNLTLTNLIDVYTSREYLIPLRNTLILATLTTLLSLSIGVGLAWLTKRTDLPWVDKIESFIVVPFFLSPFTMALAWIALGSKNSGLVNLFIYEVFGIKGLLNIFSFSGVLWVMVISHVPIAYLFVIGPMASMDSAVEEAAKVVGANTFRTLKDITIPLLTPGLISAGMLIFILCTEMYSVPGLLGQPAGFYSLAYKVLVDMTIYPVQRSHAAAGALSLLLITIICIIIYWKAIQASHRYVTVGGKSYAKRPSSLGWAKYLILALVLFYLFLSTILPYGALICASLLPFFSPYFGLENLSLDHYRHIFTDEFLLRSLFNTITIAIFAATFCTAVCTLIAFVIQKTKSTIGKTSDFVSTLPLAIPGVLFGVGFLWTFIRSPLYGTIIILVLVNFIRWQPFGLGVIKSGLIQISKELEEGARVCGASALRSAVTISIPLIKKSLLASWLFIIIMSIKELAASLFLVTNKSNVISVIAWDYAASGDYCLASAIAFIQTLMILTMMLISNKVFRIDIKRI
jgi:iron(III) transport system permease protein